MSTKYREDEDDLRADIPQTLDSHSSRTIESYGIVNGDVLLVSGIRNARAVTNKQEEDDGQEEDANSQPVLDQILDKVVITCHAVFFAFCMTTRRCAARPWRVASRVTLGLHGISGHQRRQRRKRRQPPPRCGSGARILPALKMPGRGAGACCVKDPRNGAGRRDWRWRPCAGAGRGQAQANKAVGMCGGVWCGGGLHASLARVAHCRQTSAPDAGYSAEHSGGVPLPGRQLVYWSLPLVDQLELVGCRRPPASPPAASKLPILIPTPRAGRGRRQRASEWQEARHACRQPARCLARCPEPSCRPTGLPGPQLSRNFARRFSHRLPEGPGRGGGTWCRHKAILAASSTARPLPTCRIPQQQSAPLVPPRRWSLDSSPVAPPILHPGVGFVASCRHPSERWGPETWICGPGMRVHVSRT